MQREAHEQQLKSVEVRNLKKIVLGKSQLLGNPHIRNAYLQYTQGARKNDGVGRTPVMASSLTASDLMQQSSL